MAAILLKKKQEQLKRNEAKWTPPLMEAGWTVIPSIILEHQHALGLDAIDVNIIIHIARHWWYADRHPFPSKKTIARCMGVDESTVRRHIAALEVAGFVERVERYDRVHGGRQTNEYRLDGLIRAATPFAEALIEEREKRDEESVARRTSKRPKKQKSPKLDVVES